MSLESRARSLGIPMKMVIDDGLRYQECNAHAATLTSIEGKHAIYKGECGVGHTYEQKFLIADLKASAGQKYSIVNGKLTIGKDKIYKAKNLEEY